MVEALPRRFPLFVSSLRFAVVPLVHNFLEATDCGVGSGLREDEDPRNELVLVGERKTQASKQRTTSLSKDKAVYKGHVKK